MKTIVSVNQISIYKAGLTWYSEKRCEGDNMCPNTDLDILQKLVTKLTRHETSDLYCLAPRNGQHSMHKNNSVEFKSRGQVSRRTGFSKSVKTGHCLVTRPAIVLKGQGISTTFRAYSAMRDDRDAEMKGVLGDKYHFRAHPRRKSHCNLDDTAWRC